MMLSEAAQILYQYKFGIAKHEDREQALKLGFINGAPYVVSAVFCL
jgi:hypothetical protein